MNKNEAGQVIGAQMTNASTGADFNGVVTVYVTGDGGAQAIGSVGSGLCTLKGKGYYTYRPAQAETNYDLIAFTFTGSGAITATMTVPTITPAQIAALQGATAGSGVTITLVSDLLTMALKRINVVQAGQNATGDDLRDALAFANLWFDSLSTERFTIPFVQRSVFALSTTKGTPTAPYTVGSGGDINIPKPVYLDRMNFYDTSTTPFNEIPMHPLTDGAYESLPQKTQTGTYPIFWYYSATYASNLGSVYVAPIPTSGTLVGVLYAPSAIQQFTSLSQTVVLPPGYKFFIQENLAVFFGSTFRENLPVDPELKQSARDTKRNLKAVNLPMADLLVDAGWLGRGGRGSRSNIYTDW